LGIDLNKFDEELGRVGRLVNVKGGFDIRVFSIQEEKVLKHCFSFWFLLSLRRAAVIRVKGLF